MADAIDVKGLRELLAKATPGPWKCGRGDMQSYDGETGRPFNSIYWDDPNQKIHMGSKLPGVVARLFADNNDPSKDDAELIVAAVNALPALLDRLEVAESTLAMISNEGVKGLPEDKREASVAPPQASDDTLESWWSQIHAHLENPSTPSGIPHDPPNLIGCNQEIWDALEYMDHKTFLRACDLLAALRKASLTPQTHERLSHRSQQVKILKTIDEGVLLENVRIAAEKVMEWSWDDVDAEPNVDLCKLQAALDDVNDLRRVALVTGARGEVSVSRVAASSTISRRFTHADCSGIGCEKCDRGSVRVEVPIAQASVAPPFTPYREWTCTSCGRMEVFDDEHEPNTRCPDCEGFVNIRRITGSSPHQRSSPNEGTK